MPPHMIEFVAQPLTQRRLSTSSAALHRRPSSCALAGFASFYCERLSSGARSVGRAVREVGFDAPRYERVLGGLVVAGSSGATHRHRCDGGVHRGGQGGEDDK